MKKIILAAPLLLAALITSGCEDIPGVLSVTQSFDVMVKRKIKTINVGEHQTSLDFKKNRVVATVDTGSEKMKIELTVPENAQIPSNGSFQLTAQQSGQPFDVSGDVQTDVKESEMRSDYESCTYQDYYTICNPNECKTVPVTRYGRRFVDYYIRETNQRMQFDMTKAGDSRSQFSHFEGAARYSQKIVTRESTCL